MAINSNFEHFTNQNEQNLVQDLTDELIQNAGIDVRYIVRELINEDIIFQEDSFSNFQEYFEIEAYIESVDSFGGEGSFLSKFGVEIRDQLELTISQRRWGEEVSTFNTIQTDSNTINDIISDDGTTKLDVLSGGRLFRPFEGDLIFFPLSKQIYEIRNVGKDKNFYPRGTLPTFSLDLELFEYGNENIDTLSTSDGTELANNISEIVAQNENIVVPANTATSVTPPTFSDRVSGQNTPSEFEDIIDFTEQNPFSESF